MMYKIGITGGVGSGKSEIMKHLQQRGDSSVCMADAVANELILPGRVCYEPIVQLLGMDILGEDGRIDRAKMADKIFNDGDLLGKVNAIIHPAVKDAIIRQIEISSQTCKVFFFLEAALLIEDNYKNILDEIWFVYSDKDKRIKRLRQSRAYSFDKIERIMSSQMSENEYRNACDCYIENDGELKNTLEFINEKLDKCINCDETFLHQS